MSVIYKYPLEVTDKQSVNLPKGCQILSVQTQFGKPCLWALVDEHEEKEPRIIHTFGTGNEISIDTENLSYISTYQLDGGGLIFHTFVENNA